MKRALVITYYWPPAGGSGVQRWMYFCKYLREFGIEPVVLTVDEHQASYRFRDVSFNELVSGIEVHRTATFEPLKLYSRIVSGNASEGIPIGFAGESRTSLFQKISRAVRGNLFIPDARVGWVSYAVKKAGELMTRDHYRVVITTGPPHSTHLIALKLKKKHSFTWFADFRDPWSELYYNRLLYRSSWAKQKDRKMEQHVLQQADRILTIGPSMKKHLLEKGGIPDQKIDYIYNGYDEHDFYELASHPDSRYFTISHIGMLSESQPVTPFVNALQTIARKGHPVIGRLRIRLIGNVSPGIISEIRSGLPDVPVEHIGYVPKKEAIAYMCSSDLLFNSMPEMEDSELMVTGKLMEYIATGVPVLGLGNPRGDAAQLVSELGIGRVIRRSETAEIVDFLESAFTMQSDRTISPENLEKIRSFSRYETTRRLASILERAL